MTKSRKRILLSSIAMLLVALVALGSATFAWFTVNKVVTADTIKVQAAVADGLVITNKADPQNGDWAAKVSFDSNATTLYAASMNVAAVGTSGSTLTGGTTKLVYAKDVKVGGTYSATGYSGAATASNWDEATLSSVPATGVMFDADNYSAAYSFKVASSGDAISGDVTAAISATSTGSVDGRTYMKAALCDSAGKVIGFWNDGGYTAITDTTPTVAANAAATAKTTDITAISTTVPAKANAAQFYLYVWCEGNDGQCSDDYPNGDANFTVTFTLD